MFASLSDKLALALKKISGLHKISEDNISDALKDVHSALLSADVHFRVAKDFIEKVKQECIGQNVLKSISPSQQIIKVIHDQIVELLGSQSPTLPETRPLKIMLVGLHGSGKTTSSVKLANFLKKRNYKPALVAADVYRPAAIDQLISLASQASLPVFSDKSSKNVPNICKQGLDWAIANQNDLIIFDTAGRLEIDAPLLAELQNIKSLTQPDEILLVVDSALGQEAVNIAKKFNEAVQITGVILTKLDGDAKGGAAFSIKASSNTPIKFIGTGEKIDNFDFFHPQRLAQRILGMGDVVSLVERAQESIDKDEAQKLAQKIKKADFSLEDFLSQLQQIKKIGSVSSIASMIPGLSKLQIGDDQEKQLKHTEAIIRSMTRQERLNPKIIDGSRRLRISKGSGRPLPEINRLLNQFKSMKDMMKSFKNIKGDKLKKKLSNMKDIKNLLPFNF